MSLEINKYTNTYISSQWLRFRGEKKHAYIYTHKSKGRLLYLLVRLQGSQHCRISSHAT